MPRGKQRHNNIARRIHIAAHDNQLLNTRLIFKITLQPLRNIGWAVESSKKTAMQQNRTAVFFTYNVEGSRLKVLGNYLPPGMVVL